MTYAVEVPRKVQKQVARLPTDVQSYIDAAIRDLSQDPRPPGCRRLSRRGDEWRIRVGDYRIVYEIHDDSRKVLVLEVWHRQRGYG
jgi:mRNA interferase RelE/StbE